MKVAKRVNAILLEDMKVRSRVVCVIRTWTRLKTMGAKVWRNKVADFTFWSKFQLKPQRAQNIFLSYYLLDARHRSPTGTSPLGTVVQYFSTIIYQLDSRVTSFITRSYSPHRTLTSEVSHMALMYWKSSRTECQLSLCLLVLPSRLDPQKNCITVTDSWLKVQRLQKSRKLSLV